MKDCAWCGLPMEVKARWTTEIFDSSGHRRHTYEAVTAECLGGHWYSGPAEVVES